MSPISSSRLLLTSLVVLLYMELIPSVFRIPTFWYLDLKLTRDSIFDYKVIPFEHRISLPAPGGKWTPIFSKRTLIVLLHLAMIPKSNANALSVFGNPLHS